MLHFTGKLRDALTLAHELGHGMHDRLAPKQDAVDFHPRRTPADTGHAFAGAPHGGRTAPQEQGHTTRRPTGRWACRS